MKIKDYKLFLESNFFDDRTFSLESTSINTICRYYSITNYTINEDETVDVDGDVNLYRRKLTKLPLKFGKVTGYFNCSENQLTTLEGSPKWVGGYFSCYNNKLTTLEGGPVTVIDGYYCYDNKLINFKGFPEDYDLYVKFNFSQPHIWHIFHGNPVFKLFGPIPFEKWDKFIYWCNEYDAIDNDGKVIPERMEEVYQKLGLEYED